MNASRKKNTDTTQSNQSISYLSSINISKTIFKNTDANCLNKFTTVVKFAIHLPYVSH